MFWFVLARMKMFDNSVNKVNVYPGTTVLGLERQIVCRYNLLMSQCALFFFPLFTWGCSVLVVILISGLLTVERSYTGQTFCYSYSFYFFKQCLWGSELFIYWDVGGETMLGKKYLHMCGLGKSPHARHNGTTKPNTCFVSFTFTSLSQVSTCKRPLIKRPGGLHRFHTLAQSCTCNSANLWTVHHICKIHSYIHHMSRNIFNWAM